MDFKKNKRNFIFRIFLVGILTVSIIFSLSIVSIADDEDENQGIIEQSEIEEVSSIINGANETYTNAAGANKTKPTINSRRYVIYDRTSGLPIYGKDENKQTAMASTTKIMTATIVLENCKDLNEVVTIDAKAAATGGSRLGLKKDDKITVNDLLYGLMLRSGNDAAVALAQHIGRKY